MFAEILYIDITVILKSIANFMFIVAIAYFLHFIFDYLLKFFLKKTKTHLDDNILIILRTPVFWSLLLIGIYLVFAPLIVSDVSLKIYHNIFTTITVAVWVVTIVRIIQVVVGEVSQRLRHNHSSSFDTLVPVINNITILGAFVLIVLLILGIWGIGVTPIIASAGIIGAGLAFAAKDTVANFIGGISVIFDKTYKVGDYVVLGENKYRGEVIEIGMRSTKIRTRDNVLLSVPNAVMVTNAVVNETGFDPKLRIRIPLSISYNSDLSSVEKILLYVAGENPNVLKSIKPLVRYRSFEESGIRLELLCTIVKPSLKGIIIHELLKEIHIAFKKNNIVIPYPQRDVYLHNQPIK